MLSIIIPCYNAGRYISDCIEAIERAGKEFKNLYEIIIVNDGSTDNTKEALDSACKRYTDLGGVKIINTSNFGVSHARNVGIKNAIGEYIWFIDADDDISHNSISAIIKALEEYSPDILLFNYNIIQNGRLTTADPIVSQGELCSEEIIKEIVPHLFGWSQSTLDRLFAGKTLSETKGFLSGAVWHYVFKRSIITENDIYFNQDIKLNEDSMYVLRYLCYTQMLRVLPENLYNYNLSNSGSMYKMLTNYLALFKNKVELARERNSINNLFLQKHNVDLSYCYDGSLFLSAMELCVKLSGKSYKYIKLFKEYSSLPPVVQAIDRINTANAPLRYRIPIFFLQKRLYYTLYTLVFIYQKTGYSIRM